MRKRPVPDRVVERLEETVAQQAQQINQTEDEILGELGRHEPAIWGYKRYAPLDGGHPMHPGNHPRDIRLVCLACRVQWPCKQMNTLRRMYSTVKGYEVRPDLGPAEIIFYAE